VGPALNVWKTGGNGKERGQIEKEREVENGQYLKGPSDHYPRPTWKRLSKGVHGTVKLRKDVEGELKAVRAREI